MSELVLFHGDKGGVGKSFAASVYIDRELANGRAPVVIDSDLRNPDVIRMFQGKLNCEQLDLSVHEGWMDLYDAMSENQDADFIVSMPSQIGGSIADEADTLIDAMRSMGRKLAVVWMINRLLDSIHLLKRAMEDLEGVDRLLVVKNGFFGGSDKFYRWDGSNIKRQLLEAGHVEAFLPELHERVIDRITENPMPFSVALQEAPLKFSERVELESWLRKAHAVYEPLDAIA